MTFDWVKPGSTFPTFSPDASGLRRTQLTCRLVPSLYNKHPRSVFARSIRVEVRRTRFVGLEQLALPSATQKKG